MKLLFPTRPLARDEVAALLEELGFRLTSDEPTTSGTRWTSWQRGDDAAGYFTRGAAATSGFKIVGPDAAGVAREIAGRVQARDASDLLVPPRDGVTARVRHAYALGTLVYLEAAEAVEAKRQLSAMLLDDEPLVRWAVVESLPIDKDSEDALEASAARFPEMRGVMVRMRAARIAREEGTLHDTETDDRWELLRRAREGAEEGKWRRVAKAMDVLLRDSPWDDEGLHLRGLAHEGEGELLEALFLLGAAERAMASSESVRRRVAAEADDGDLDRDDDGDLDGGDEDDDDAITSDAIEAVRAKVADLRERTRASDPEAEGRAAPVVTGWLEAWESGSQSAQQVGGARALRGRLPALEGLLTYVVGRYDGDEELLRAAHEAVPDAPTVAVALAHAIKKRDEAEGLRRLAALRATVRAAGEPSPSARAIEDLVVSGGRRSPASEASIVETLAQHAYDARDYERAVDLADELVLLHPDTGLGWQLRANARIFALRHEEAVGACTEAIQNLDRIYDRGRAEGSIFFGTDPRAAMYFNRSCVEAKLGRRDDAIESLRVAVRKDEKYAEEAVADDYMDSLFEDPEFKAIVAKDPRALRTKEERDPTWVASLVARARDEQQSGNLRAGFETASRAAALAEDLDAPAVLVEALAVLGRMQAFNGELDLALETSARAVELARRDDVPPAVRAVAHAQRGICLQATMRLGEAREAYERAFEERRRAFGDGHPSLVKSLVSIVGVALAEERPAPEIEALLARGVDIAQAYFASDPAKDHVWAEAVDDLVSLLVRRSLLRHANGEVEPALQPLSLALDRLEEQRAVGYAPMATVVDQIRGFADAIAGAAPSPVVAAAAVAVRGRAEAILIPGPPAERKVRLVFHRVRAFVDQLRAGGVDEARIAGLLADVVRGGDAVPSELRDVEALASLRAVLAVAAAREPTVLVTSAMALSMAAMPGELDRALRDLEELVAPVAADG